MTPAPHCSDAEDAPNKPVGHKPYRLTKRAEFLRVASKGRRTAVHGLVLQGLERGDAGLTRLGFTVTKKIGNAVLRNRTRRRLKEAARLHFAEFPAGDVDLVLIGRSSTRDRHFEDLKDDIRRALSKLSLSRSQAP